MPERPAHGHLGNRHLATAQQIAPCPIEPAKPQPMGRRHTGKGLECLLQLAQGNAGNVRQLQQVKGFFGAVGSPLTDPLHDRPLLSPPPQRSALQLLAGVVQDEQAVFQQLFGQRLPRKWTIGFPQPCQGSAEPAAEQRILAAAQRHHEQAVKALRVEGVAGQEGLVEHHRHFLVVLRCDPDIAALFVEQVQAVLTAVEAERQCAAGGTEKLLDPRVEALFVHLYAIQAQATQLAAEVAGRHLPVLLLPTGGGAHLLGHIAGVEGLDLQGIGRCHAAS